MTTNERYEMIKKSMVDCYSKIVENIYVSLKENYGPGNEIWKGEYEKYHETLPSGRISKRTSIRRVMHKITEEEYIEHCKQCVNAIDDGYHTNIHCNPDDSTTLICVNFHEPKDEDVNGILRYFDTRYREHVIGVKPSYYDYTGKGVKTISHFDPIFDTEEIDKDFWGSYDLHCKAKAEWCEKYGCD